MGKLSYIFFYIVFAFSIIFLVLVINDEDKTTSIKDEIRAHLSNTTGVDVKEIELITLSQGSIYTAIVNNKVYKVYLETKTNKIIGMTEETFINK